METDSRANFCTAVRTCWQSLMWFRLCWSGLEGYGELESKGEGEIRERESVEKTKGIIKPLSHLQSIPKIFRNISCMGEQGSLFRKIWPALRHWNSRENAGTAVLWMKAVTLHGQACKGLRLSNERRSCVERVNQSQDTVTKKHSWILHTVHWKSTRQKQHLAHHVPENDKRCLPPCTQTSGLTPSSSISAGFYDG